MNKYTGGFGESKGFDTEYDDGPVYDPDYDPEYDPEDELMELSRRGGLFAESNRGEKDVEESEGDDTSSYVSADDVSVGSVEREVIGFNDLSRLGMVNDISLMYGDDSFVKCVAKIMIDLNMDRDDIDRAIQNIKYIGPDSFTLNKRNCAVYVFANFKFIEYKNPPDFKQSDYKDSVDEIGIERYLRYMNNTYKKIG
jgi:hypothetical protein